MTAPGRDAEIVARLRAGYEAFNRGDYAGVLERLGVDDRFEFHRVGGLDIVRGRAAFREWMKPDAFEDQTFEPLEFKVNGNKVLVRARVRGRGPGSGIEVDAEVYSVLTLDEDEVFVRAENFLPHERVEALRAAGLEPRD
jgi:ketosteroid isomerase-like protein